MCKHKSIKIMESWSKSNELQGLLVWVFSMRFKESNPPCLFGIYKWITYIITFPLLDKSCFLDFICNNPISTTRKHSNQCNINWFDDSETIYFFNSLTMSLNCYPFINEALLGSKFGSVEVDRVRGTLSMALLNVNNAWGSIHY